MPKGLGELRQKRFRWIKANRENNFEGGIKRLLTDLYPDNAHFIYELLQNAEDAEATRVEFILDKDYLGFEHDGTRLFTLSDVESITSIGASTKLDDPTSIGKFGVGFKAVFAYTNTPEIHSGEFHFRIHDLVVPQTDGVDQSDVDSYGTLFRFPFDHPSKRPEQARSEIERALGALGHNTLLFLRHIRRIEYCLPNDSSNSDDSSAILERIDHRDGHIEIRSTPPSSKDTTSSHWLRFEKDVAVIDEIGTNKNCRIAIVYQLKVDQADKKPKIEPVNYGQVSIYFPADKETSNLRFHIHAPFASTVARDSVRDCEANAQLRDRIAELVVESLVEIRDKQMLTMGFLSVLPVPTDNLLPFYEPIREKIVQAFRNQPLTPTKGGSHSRATALFRGPARISDVLSDDDLSVLTYYEPPLWVANPPQQNQREDRFLESLEIRTWGWSELGDILEAPHLTDHTDDQEFENSFHKDRIENWIKEKSDTWIMRFYALMGEACDYHYQCVDANDVRIVRVDAGQGHEHVLPKDAFFMPDREMPPIQNIRIVKPSVYKGLRSDAQRKLAALFLEHIGVRPFDEKVVIQLRLSRYDDPPAPCDGSHYDDLNQFIDYWKNNPGSASDFKEHTFLLGIDEDEQLYWLEPDNICLDTPYVETGLADIRKIHQKFLLWDGYFVKLASQLDDFVGFLRAVGVQTHLPIERVSCVQNPQWRYLACVPGNRLRSLINQDYTIQGLNQLLAEPSLQNAKLIWNTMYSHRLDSECLEARFQKNERGGCRSAQSQLVHALKNNSWVPQCNELFVRPTEISPEMLPEGFLFDPEWPWIKAIDFGTTTQERTKQYQQKLTVVRELGFESVAELEKWKEVKNLGILPEEVISQHDQRSRISQPEEPVLNPERRRKGVLERKENTPPKESVTRERTIQPGTKLEICNAKAYLRAKYKNADGQLICQCCHAEMPFKIQGEYYFEAIQCLRGLENHYFENRLALCPTCAAMYQNALETDNTEIRRSIIEHEASASASSAEITITLAGRNFQLRFVGTHWFDLKTVLIG